MMVSIVVAAFLFAVLFTRIADRMLIDLLLDWVAAPPPRPSIASMIEQRQRAVAKQK
jgi:hypothetical protein